MRGLCRPFCIRRFCAGLRFCPWVFAVSCFAACAPSLGLLFSGRSRHAQFSRINRSILQIYCPFSIVLCKNANHSALPKSYDCFIIPRFCQIYKAQATASFRLRRISLTHFCHPAHIINHIRRFSYERSCKRFGRLLEISV